MMEKAEKILPRWVKKLWANHPGAERPTAENPTPAWLEGQLKKVPLWYRIREVNEPRWTPPFYLIEDLRSQPELMREAFELEPTLIALAEKLISEQVEHLIFLGCGSAFFTSVLAEFLFLNLASVTAKAYESLEFANYFVPSPQKTAIIAQSATGGSIETLEAVRRAQAEGLYTIALTNTPNSPLESLANETVVFPTNQRCGPDISVITTRLMILYLLALQMGLLKGTDATLLRNLYTQLQTIPDVIEQFLEEQNQHLADLSSKFKDKLSFFIVGGGANYFSAIEGALKIEEEASMICKPYRPAEYPHDAIALLSDRIVTVVVAPPSKSYRRLQDVVRAAKAIASPTLAIVLKSDEIISRLADEVIPISAELDEMLMPPICTVIFQLLGYYLGVARGYNPDTLHTDDIAHAKAWLTAFPLGHH